MLKPEKMQRVRLISMESVVRPLVSELHRLGMVEIRRFNAEGFDTGKTVEAYDRISSNLVRIRSIKTMLGLSGQYAQETDMELDKALRLAEDFHIEDELRRKHAAMEKANNEISSLQAKLRELDRLSGFNIDFSKLSSSSVSFAVGSIPAKNLPSLKNELKKCSRCNFESRIVGQDAMVVAAHPADDASAELALSRMGFAPIDISGFTTPAKTRQEFKARITQLDKEAEAAKKEIAAMSEKYKDKVLTIDKVLTNWSERALVTKEFAFGKQTAIFEGWVKEKDYASLQSTLETKFGKKINLERIKSKEEPPVVLNNPKSTAPFQFLVELFSLPKADEIDPTIILLFSVPIIYGMMMGDVVYGLVSFIVSNWLMKKFKKGGLGYGAASLWRFSAISGMIFGVIFNEWGGFTLYQIFEHLQEWGLINLAAMGITGPIYEGFSRSHQTSMLIGISILLGLVQIAFGFFLGALNAWEHDRKHAIAKLSWIFIELGGTLIVCAMFINLLPTEPYLTIGGVIFGLAFIIMVITEGAMGILELPALLGNVLSYARIAAVGLVGLLLAELINETFVPHPEQGIVYALIMLPILIFLHLFNMGLAMFECIVQGGRLNLVEFFGKFYHGGGKAFTPFSMNVKK